MEFTAEYNSKKPAGKNYRVMRGPNGQPVTGWMSKSDAKEWAQEHNESFEAEQAQKKVAEILENVGMTQGTAEASEIIQAHSVADEEGIIQAADMVQLHWDPTTHTATRLSNVLELLGCVKEA